MNVIRVKFLLPCATLGSSHQEQRDGTGWCASMHHLTKGVLQLLYISGCLSIFPSYPSQVFYFTVHQLASHALKSLKAPATDQGGGLLEWGPLVLMPLRPIFSCSFCNCVPLYEEISIFSVWFGRVLEYCSTHKATQEWGENTDVKTWLAFSLYSCSQTPQNTSHYWS